MAVRMEPLASFANLIDVFMSEYCPLKKKPQRFTLS